MVINDKSSSRQDKPILKRSPMVIGSILANISNQLVGMAKVVIKDRPQSTISFYIFQRFTYKTLGQSLGTSFLKSTPCFHTPSGIQ